MRSETSSEDNDLQEQVVIKEESTATKRSYECTFCKRGFTNAQALGGHMNIHRKDRAKAKQVTASSSISPKSNHEDHMMINPNHYMPQFSSEPMNYYPVLEAQRNYPVKYFQASESSSPRLPHGSGNFQTLNMNEQLWGKNLSLQIGSNHSEDHDIEQNNEDVSKEDELDLELRLGHDRY